MLFAYDTETALLAAVELVNSAGAPDAFANTEQLRSFYDRHRYTGRFDAHEAALQAVRALRGELRELLTEDRDNAAEHVNAILAEAKALPRLVRHNELDWHIHAVDEDAPFHRRVAVETAMFKNLTPPPPAIAKQLGGPRTKYVPIPEKYERVETSGLSVEVDRGKKQLDIEIP